MRFIDNMPFRQARSAAWMLSFGALALLVGLAGCQAPVASMSLQPAFNPYGPNPYDEYIHQRPVERYAHARADVARRQTKQHPLVRRARRAAYSGPTYYPARARLNHRWTHIIIHHSATDRGGAVAFDKVHREQNGWDELGYHFVIGNGTDTADGQVEIGGRWHKQKHGAHCKTPDNYYNDHGIGICLVGDFTTHPPSRAQMDALVNLCRFLMHTCDIPLDKIYTHRHATHRTACPGRQFPLATLKRRLAPSVTAADFP